MWRDAIKCVGVKVGVALGVGMRDVEKCTVLGDS